MAAAAGVATVTAAASLAIGQGWGATEVSVVPASDCPETQSTLESAGLSFDTFSERCPTPAETERIIANSSAEASGTDSIRSNTVDHLNIVLERVRSGELHVDGFTQDELIEILNATVSLVEDSSLTPDEERVLSGGAANTVLDALRASGDFPEDPTQPIDGQEAE